MEIGSAMMNVIFLGYKTQDISKCVPPREYQNLFMLNVYSCL